MGEGYAKRTFRLQDLEERGVRGCHGGNVTVHFGLADSLARSGKLREAMAVYAFCCRKADAVPTPDRLRHLSLALLECVAGPKRQAPPAASPVAVQQVPPPTAAPPPHRGPRHLSGGQAGAVAPGGRGSVAAGGLASAPGCFACPCCEGVLYQPVTAACGHTFCRKCLTAESGKPCVRCGHRLNVAGPLETNVLIKSLVEKWWAPDLKAVQLRDEGNELFGRNQVESALQKYDEAVRLAPNNHLLLSNRSHAFYRLNRLQEALADAENVVRLKPSWGKGHYRRGVALFALGRYEDALCAFCSCVAIDGNPQALRSEVSQVLLRILLPCGGQRGGGRPPSPNHHHHHHPLLSPALYSLCLPRSYSLPYSLGSSPVRHRRNSQHRGSGGLSPLRPFGGASCPSSPPDAFLPSLQISPPSPPSARTDAPSAPGPQDASPGAAAASRNQMELHYSDCEDNSSGEDDSPCTHLHRRYSLNAENTHLQGVLDKLFREMEKLKRAEFKASGNAPIVLTAPSPESIDAVDFDCVLCCRTLWSPVTTPCGHTYCWVCLDRCLDYSCACPLCMASLADYLATSPRSVTEFVEQALWTYLPAEYETRQVIHRQELSEGGPGSVNGLCSGSEGLRVEPRVPIFVCTAAFPHVPCPLFVYEPRYRLMVRRCVETGGRQFGIAACISSSRRNDGLSSRYADYGTMLEMRDWVLMGDGCSILSTVGVRRFRVITRGERDGYDTAQVQFIQDQPILPEQINGIKQLHNKIRKKSCQWMSMVGHSIRMEIERTFGLMPDVEPDDSWLTLPDGPAWVWWILAILPLGQNLQVGILATTSLEKRLRAVDKTLDHMQRQIVTTTDPSSSSPSSSTTRGSPSESSTSQRSDPRQRNEPSSAPQSSSSQTAPSQPSARQESELRRSEGRYSLYDPDS
ncbi:LON peptidase N-terminal domain and RING finger protein 3 [Ischnura elegans]|uniref:LON peptidase N-terminal domain and RING finger protein 3 n=1 Tax=Ischnura elegans TaxID=197161 RepID=UPI001ED88051|nr:LON peptidase N-terminal domain and RING finger protein 3 [Ischnura elegans]